ncbi:MAG: UDP-4-amino-4,6-dideoxy-N-acetyl-beta-L-altrosamine transaminase [Candidatus Omnitrophica bacterium]|nr:UDP-4-amino-4,6-dideoxy-N-acetyl-beta-L-altrosamine transaminase [Candidatus Omnitrophota bacterium]
MMKIPYARHVIDRADIANVVKVLKSDFITQGPVVERFEKRLLSYCGAKYAVVFSSGTAALHAAYSAAGLSWGDNFITTPNTFAATANAGLLLGAKPVFVDIESNTGNIDVSKVGAKINKKTKLVVPVHYAGNVVDLKDLQELAIKHNFMVIEDACHALGSKYEKSMIGNCRYSDMAVFSFHPAKTITTGEGGAVLTNNPLFYRKLFLFRNHGINKSSFMGNPHGDWYYEMQSLGCNYRLTDMQSALGFSQLRKLNKFISYRRKIAQIYNRAFFNNPFFDVPTQVNQSSCHLYVIRLKNPYVDKKKEIFATLRKNGLGVQVHYIPVYMHPYYRSLGYKEGLCPVAEDFYRRAITIPLSASLKNKEIKYIIETVKLTVQKCCK